MANKPIYYKGFSSFEFQSNKTFKLTDVELVKMDLLNHIFTRRGERVMMPTFGTIVPDIVFEPLDEETISTVYEEIEAVFDYDPRVEVVTMNVSPNYDENSLTLEALLRYVEFNVIDEFNLNIQFEGI